MNCREPMKIWFTDLLILLIIIQCKAINSQGKNGKEIFIDAVLYRGEILAEELDAWDFLQKRFCYIS
jgi:hypothetical protein